MNGGRGLRDTLAARLVEAVCEAVNQPLSDRLTELTQMHAKNILALAVAGSRTSAVDAVLAVSRVAGGDPVYPIPGRRERADEHHASMAIGLAAHIHDFDDTHLVSIIHPSASTMAATLTAGIAAKIDGARFLRAFAIGCEIQLRVGTAMSPHHYERGWHATGTCGVIGAAVAAGVAGDSSPTTLRNALALAANSSLGHRETFGTPIKPFHAGKAAANGIMAVRLAEEGFEAPADALERFFAAMAPHHDAGALVDGIGEQWEFESDMIKPYPCGLVIHPLIDAGLLVNNQGFRPADIVALTVDANPLVTDLTNIRNPRDGLEARFSAVHGLAAAIVDGRVDLESYEKDRVEDPVISRLRDLTVVRVDERCRADAVTVVARHTDGREDVFRVAHARGSARQPLTYGEVERKVEKLLRPVLGVRSALLPAAVEALPNARTLNDLCAAVALESRPPE